MQEYRLVTRFTRLRRTGGRVGAWIAAACFALILAAAHDARAATTLVPEFLELNAVEPSDGGFVAVGPLQSTPGETDLKSAFIKIDAAGNPIGEPIELPAPAGFGNAVVYDLVQVQGGEFIAVGSVQSSDSEDQRDIWLIRFDATGKVAWNKAYGTRLDERLYSVKRLADGRFIAAGRRQVSARGSDPSAGYAVWFTSDGNITHDQEYHGQCRLRCAFQDVAQLPNGNLGFVGWITTNDRSDDLWVMGTSADGTPLAPVPPQGKAGNDIAWSIISIGQYTAIAGTLRDTGGSSSGLLLLSSGKVLTLPQTSGGDLRSLRAALKAGSFVVVGAAAINSSNRAPYFAVVDANGNVAPQTEPLPRGHADGIFLDVAVDSVGNIAMVGQAAVDRRQGPFDGLIGTAGGAAQCGKNSGEPLLLSMTPGSETVGCAGPEPAEFKISGRGGDAGIFVSAMSGSVDVLLKEGDQVIDASLNRGKAPEFVTLPPNGDDITLVVVPETAAAQFKVKPVEVSEPAPDAALADQLGQDFGPDLMKQAFDILGYDEEQFVTPDSVSSGADVAASARQATLAFQTANGSPATGTLTTDEFWQLLIQATEAAEAPATSAAYKARSIAADHTPITFKGANGTAQITSFQGALKDGAVYGIGKFASGAAFEGEWRGDRNVINSAARPYLGVLTTAKGCTVAATRFNSASAYSYSDLPPSITLVRHDGTLLFRGLISGNSWNGSYTTQDWYDTCFGK